MLREQPPDRLQYLVSRTTFAAVTRYAVQQKLGEVASPDMSPLHVHDDIFVRQGRLVCLEEGRGGPRSHIPHGQKPEWPRHSDHFIG